MSEPIKVGTRVKIIRGFGQGDITTVLGYDPESNIYTVDGDLNDCGKVKFKDREDLVPLPDNTPENDPYIEVKNEIMESRKAEAMKNATNKAYIDKMYMRYPIVAFIGSMKYWEYFLSEAERLYKKGNIIILPMKDSNPNELSEDQMKIYDMMIRAQINMADEVHVINKGGYIGESTRSELNYARSIGKIISYMEPCNENGKRAKIITLCGSFKFMDEFKSITEKLSLNGVVVFTPTACTVPIYYETLSENQIDMLHDIHYQKIDMADEVWIIDKDQYIGDDTRREIEYAQGRNKEIYYYQTIKNERLPELLKNKEESNGED